MLSRNEETVSNGRDMTAITRFGLLYGWMITNHDWFGLRLQQWPERLPCNYNRYPLLQLFSQMQRPLCVTFGTVRHVSLFQAWSHRCLHYHGTRNLSRSNVCRTVSESHKISEGTHFIPSYDIHRRVCKRGTFDPLGTTIWVDGDKP